MLHKRTSFVSMHVVPTAVEATRSVNGSGELLPGSPLESDSVTHRSIS